jgi:fucose permease
MSQSIRLQVAICVLTLILLGASGTLLGATLPELARALHIRLEMAGLLFTTQAFGGLVSVPVAGRLLDAAAQKIVLAGGTFLLAVGLAGTPFCHNLTGAALALFIFGLGFGFLALAPNVIVASLYRERSGSALNILNVFYGLGSIFGPIATGLSIDKLGNFRYAYWLLAGLVLFLFASVLLVRFSALGHRSEARAGIPWGGLFLLLVGYFYLDVGLEISFSGWIFTYLRQRPVLSVVTASLALSIYWMAATSARLLGAWLLRWLSEAQLLSICAAVAGVAISSLLLVGKGVLLNLAAVGLVGLSLGPLFPTGLSVTNKAYPRAMGTVSGMLLAAGTFGGMTVPWVQGEVTGAAGPVWGMSLLLLLALLMLAVVGTIGARYQLDGNRQRPPEPGL